MHTGGTAASNPRPSLPSLVAYSASLLAGNQVTVDEPALQATITATNLPQTSHSETDQKRIFAPNGLTSHENPRGSMNSVSIHDINVTQHIFVPF
ncbi:hypothetical protein [Bradyrhizobium sp. USDA 4512]